MFFGNAKCDRVKETLKSYFIVKDADALTAYGFPSRTN
jgi:hypothetical protein